MAADPSKVIVKTGSTADAVLVNHRDIPDAQADGESPAIAARNLIGDLTRALDTPPTDQDGRRSCRPSPTSRSSSTGRRRARRRANQGGPGARKRRRPTPREGRAAAADLTTGRRTATSAEPAGRSWGFCGRRPVSCSDGGQIATIHPRVNRRWPRRDDADRDRLPGRSIPRAGGPDGRAAADRGGAGVRVGLLPEGDPRPVLRGPGAGGGPDAAGGAAGADGPEAGARGPGCACCWWRR